MKSRFTSNLGLDSVETVIESVRQLWEAIENSGAEIEQAKFKRDIERTIDRLKARVEKHLKSPLPPAQARLLFDHAEEGNGRLPLPERARPELPRFPEATPRIYDKDLTDLALRQKADAFGRHDQRIRAAYRYSQLKAGKEGPTAELKEKIRSLGKRLDNVGDLMDSEAKLQSQLLDLLDSIQTTYKTRYLQGFDQVTGKCEECRTEIEKLTASSPFGAIEELTKLDALATMDVDRLRDDVLSHKRGLFQSSLDRNAVERALKDRPLPEGCPLHVDEAHRLVADAEQAVERATTIVRSSLVNLASFLRQPALRSLLEQGKSEPFVAELLKARDDDALADLLADRIAADPANAKILAKYLKRIVVKVIHLQEFKPSKTKVEKGDIETVVGEFRKFLETAVNGDGKSQSTILEIK